MKNLTKSMAASALIFAFAAPASAAVQADVALDVRLAAGPNSDVMVDVAEDGSIVTLNGYADKNISLIDIEEAARRNGAAEVINNVHYHQ